MLERGDQLVRSAAKIGSCVPAFTIYNLETMQAALEASRLAGRDVILAFGAGYLENADFDVIARMADSLVRKHPYRVALHLDHCRSLKLLKEAARVGFTSLMYDGSGDDFALNVQETREARIIADQYNCSLEGELGGLNNEDGTGDAPTIALYTDPVLAHRYVQETNVDILAVSVGNAHGEYKGAPHISLDRLRELRDRTSIPLALHGSSGIPSATLTEAVACGIRKINVNTEVALAATAHARHMLAEKDKLRMEALCKGIRAEMARIMGTYFI
ncbi:MAG: class II fructose-bisphosphate aldolase [Eubacteriales bacterium]|nr:class II fructose-bisphosphate aldolase [Eubacteriales bacterium]